VLHVIDLRILSFRWQPKRKNTILTIPPSHQILSSIGCVAWSTYRVYDRGIHRGGIFCRRWSRRCFIISYWFSLGRECARAFLVISWRS
jgi:hypothetical protein